MTHANLRLAVPFRELQIDLVGKKKDKQVGVGGFQRWAKTSHFWKTF